jgi:hypothetical protein
MSDPVGADVDLVVKTDASDLRLRALNLTDKVEPTGPLVLPDDPSPPACILPAGGPL